MEFKVYPIESLRKKRKGEYQYLAMIRHVRRGKSGAVITLRGQPLAFIVKELPDGVLYEALESVEKNGRSSFRTFQITSPLTLRNLSVDWLRKHKLPIKLTQQTKAWGWLVPVKYEDALLGYCFDLAIAQK